MKFPRISYSFSLATCLAAGLLATTAQAQVLFQDDFEDRVRDQPLIGNDWTWFDMTFGGDTCTGTKVGEFGPFTGGNGIDDYPAENRNYWTASADVGEGDSYYRAGLAVPAWVTEDGSGALSNMLRVYGNQFNEASTCQRTLIFQEYDLAKAGAYSFSFEAAQDQNGAPANGETTFGFIKILKRSDSSFEELVFETVETTLTDTGARLFDYKIDFEVPEEYVGELLQFGFFNDVTPGIGHSWATSGAFYDNVTLSEINIGPGHTGTYFNASQDGHGFAVEFGYSAGSPVGLVYWYTYDDQGNNVFLIGVGQPEGNRLEVEFGSALGMVYGDFDPSTVSREVAGTGVFEFTGRGSAIFNYSPSMFSMNTFGHTTAVEDLELVKLFTIPADDDFETSAD